LPKVRSSYLPGIRRVTEFALLCCLLVFPYQFASGEDAGQVDNAQSHWAKDPGERSARLRRLTWERFTEITQSAGISSNLVYDIDQDDQGFIWMGTRNGLDRFDGYSIQNFRHEPHTKNSLASSDIRTIAAASNGIIWVGSHAAGLDRFDSALRTATNFRNNPGDPHDIGDDQVNQVIIDKAGDIWAATRNGGLSHIDHRTLQVTRFHTAAGGKMKIPSDEVMTLFADAEGRIWAGTGKGLIFTEDYVSGFLTVSLEIGGIADPPIIQSLHQTSDGTLVMVTADRNLLQLRWDESTKTEAKKPNGIQHPLSDLQPELISLIDSQDRVWIQSFGNTDFSVYDPVIEESVGLPNDHQTSFEDQTGAIWISNNPGVYRLDPGILVFGDLVQEIKPWSSIDHVFAVLEADDGSIFVSHTKGVWQYEPETDNSAHFALEPTYESVSNDTNALYQDRDGLIWAGTYNTGINRIDPASGVIKSYRLCEPAVDSLLCKRCSNPGGWPRQRDVGGYRERLVAVAAGFQRLATFCS